MKQVKLMFVSSFRHEHVPFATLSAHPEAGMLKASSGSS